MYDFTEPFKAPAGSPIRELFKYLSEPGMISFAGGYPASNLFDVAGLTRAMEAAWREPASCLQYGATDGSPALKAALTRLMAQRGAVCASDELIVTSGSQQGFDLLLRIFVAAGDTVLTEQPAYPATLQALRLQQAKIVTVPVDADGLDVERLAAMFESKEIDRPKLLYTVPTFANPTGSTMSLSRRVALLKLAVKYRFLVVEDDPYGDLRFSGEALPSLLALCAQVDGARDWVVHFSSLSKIVAPGLRIGWAVGPREIVRRCAVAKQTTDLCTTPWTQSVAAHYLDGDALSRHLPHIVASYREKCLQFCQALDEQLGDELTFHPPAGGMFVWGRLRRYTASDLLQSAIAQKVLFVPGAGFYADKADPQALRLSFAAPPLEDLAEGVRRLAAALRALSGGATDGF